jgi:N-methylhydantoinase A
MHRIGIDVGGTFTDVILVDTESRNVIAIKVPTTPLDPSIGVINGIQRVFKESSIQGNQVSFVGLGTTIATNLLVEGNVAKAGLLTTKGFRDSLEIRRSSRHDRADLYDMLFNNPPPLIRRQLRREIDERTLYDSSILKKIDEEQVHQEIDYLVQQGVESIAICFVHSYINETNENQVADLVRNRYPHLFVTTSHSVNPEIFEYERSSTTAINALLGPKCEKYLSSLDGRIYQEGILSGIYLMQSNGGLTRPNEAAQKPVTLLESGPAGGVTGAVKLCQRINVPNAIIGDVGGTTFDVSVIENFQPITRNITEINTCVVRAPTIDIVSIGAGGGSIAIVDAAGGIRVGPKSAGADPGPICYGQGGDQVTVTDCNLILGYLNQDKPLGDRTLDLKAAQKAIDEKIAKPLGITTLEAARSIRAIANAHMAQAIRLVTIEKGYDPRDFIYIPFGGGGPVHAVDVAELLQIKKILIPPHPGLFSAMGMLVADLRHDFQASFICNLEKIDVNQFEARFIELEEQAYKKMESSSINNEQVKIVRKVDCRYFGQADSLTIEVATQDINGVIESIKKAFHEQHFRQWNFNLKRPINITDIRVEAVANIGDYITGQMTNIKDAAKPIGFRNIFIDDVMEKIPCYARHQIIEGQKLIGPLIVEEASTSIVIKKNQELMVDRDSNLIIELKA